VQIRLVPGESPDGTSLWDFLGCVRILESAERCSTYIDGDGCLLCQTKTTLPSPANE
jgi:hypothetical protein